MATTRSTRSRSSAPRSSRPPSRKADDGLMARTGRTIREKPYVSAAIATGAVTAVAAMAAGAFFFSRRGTSDGMEGTGHEGFATRVKDGLAEAGAKARSLGTRARSALGYENEAPQSDIAEEALTLKQTGRKTRRPVDRTVSEELKTGAISY